MCNVFFKNKKYLSSKATLPGDPIVMLYDTGKIVVDLLDFVVV